MRISIWPQNKLEVVCKILMKMFSNIRIKCLPAPWPLHQSSHKLEIPYERRAKGRK